MKIIVYVVFLASLCGSASCFSTKAFAPRRALFLRHADSTTSSSSTSFAAFANSLDEKQQQQKQDESWQERLEMLLDPLTPLAQRQILLSELMASNQDIRQSVTDALRERNIDPLLTPKGKKLQDGTRAVARQLTTDILPSLAQAARSPPPSSFESVPKIGSRILEAISNQANQVLTQLEQDIRDPTRIPRRIEEQTKSVAKEMQNVFLETPEGLVGPNYTVVSQNSGYEIRDYDGYQVATTSLNKGNPASLNDLSQSGAAFNALAAYLFGANEEGTSMSMTTPVTTTSTGEMRFYLSSSHIPAPLKDGKTGMYEAGTVQIVDIPPARLAVRRFTGFVTEGEVARQKDALLSELEMDGVELDVPHGAVVPHVIFQYNPPYTIPMVRRNEIAIPVQPSMEEFNDLETEWGQDDDDNVESPSDVE